MTEFQFSTYRSEIKETAKAYGFRYDCQNAQHAGRWDEAYQWLPKRFTTIEDVEDDGSIYWQEGQVIVTVPMWLARNENYFKQTVWREY